jgi:hypothetical protein
VTVQDVRVVTGRADVVRELRAAGPLLAALRAPVTARGPWLTAALALGATGRSPRLRPVAVVVDAPGGPGAPRALATVALRGGPRLTATLLGDGLPVPAGTAPARLPAQDDDAAERLATGVLGVLDRVRRPWTLRLAGLPLGDPTLRAIGRLRPEAAFANARSARLVDTLDEAGPVHRTRDPAELEQGLAALLAREPDRRPAPRCARPPGCTPRSVRSSWRRSSTATGCGPVCSPSSTARTGGRGGGPPTPACAPRWARRWSR